MPASIDSPLSSTHISTSMDSEPPSTKAIHTTSGSTSQSRSACREKNSFTSSAASQEPSSCNSLSTISTPISNFVNQSFRPPLSNSQRRALSRLISLPEQTGQTYLSVIYISLIFAEIHPFLPPSPLAETCSALSCTAFPALCPKYYPLTYHEENLLVLQNRIEL